VTRIRKTGTITYRLGTITRQAIEDNQFTRLRGIYPFSAAC